MDLSLPTFTLETYQFCMKCIEFTNRTYNFKNLDVGSLIWSAKTGVDSSYFPQKINLSWSFDGSNLELLESTWLTESLNMQQRTGHVLIFLRKI